MNPLISTQKSTDSLQAVLHPLVALTISDYITRHTLRGQRGPIVGALLGQQNGREITIEHAFECLTVAGPEGKVLFSQPWFNERLEQMKLVHRDRKLDLVGWYTLLPRSGPIPDILLLHDQILSFNESAVLLAFHPADVLEQSVGGKLPITIYESNYESGGYESGDVQHQNKQAGGEGETEGEDKLMKDDSAAMDATAHKVKFRELPYSVEISEAEMISMDFVARGGANATAVEHKAEKKGQVLGSAKGKRRLGSQEECAAAAAATDDDAVEALSRDEAELISLLTAKANAIKMLHSRIQLIIKYLERLPPSYLQGADGSDAAAAPATTASDAKGKAKAATTATAQPYTTPSHTILRSIQALVNRLPLLVSDTEAFQREVLSESNDVHGLSLLKDIVQSTADLRYVGKGFAVYEMAKTQRLRSFTAAGGDNSPALVAPVSGHHHHLAGPGDLL